MRVELAELHRQLGITTIYVTHDQVEAMTLADRIVVLRDGCIEQIGSPLQLYDDPDNLFVAGFIGSPRINKISATVEKSRGRRALLALPGNGSWEIALETAAPPAGASVVLAVRPEHLNIAATPDMANVTMKIEYCEHLGGVSYAYGVLHDGQKIIFESRQDRNLASNGSLNFRLPKDKALLFAKSGERIR
jgi:lactose/L-arabinose transport system ATP-binding protein